MLHRDVPWQHAVYTRRNRRETYVFSHAKRCSVRKTFASSLKARCLAAVSPHANLQAMRDAPVLVLITGQYATAVSLESYAKHKGCLETLPVYLPPPHDLPEDSAECSELGSDYRVLSYHSTLANYEQGASHDWTLTEVVPMLSDMVILPKRLDERNLRPIMSSFARASRKCLADSLVLAGEDAKTLNKCRETEVLLTTH